MATASLAWSSRRDDSRTWQDGLRRVQSWRPHELAIHLSSMKA